MRAPVILALTVMGRIDARQARYLMPHSKDIDDAFDELERQARSDRLDIERLMRNELAEAQVRQVNRRVA